MTKQIQGDHTNGGGGFLMGLVAGGTIGAGLALYFTAPRLLSELRRRVADSTADLRNAASDRLQDAATRVADVADRVADTADDLTRKGQAVRDDVADVVARGAHEVGRGARAVVSRARDVEQFATASKTNPQTS